MKVAEKEILRNKNIRCRESIANMKFSLIDLEKVRIKKELRVVCEIDKIESPIPETRYIKGCSKLKVKLISGPDENIYKAMVEGALQTWGSHTKEKWSRLSPNTRFFVLKEVLEGRALPLVLEMPQFIFKISGISRASFDQIVRARIGFVACAKGVRDNNAKDWNVIVPTAIYENEKMFQEFKRCWEMIKFTYTEMVEQGRESWQSARSILGMNIEYSYIVGINYMALKNLCARRLINTEQEDTVGTVVGMWKEIYKNFPLLASYLKPMEDIKRKNLTVEVNGFSRIFGLLFGGAGVKQRWPLLDNFAKEVRFNMAGTDWDKLEEQTKVHFPYPDEWPNYKLFVNLYNVDKNRFQFV